jgi:hypothetical protein
MRDGAPVLLVVESTEPSTAEATPERSNEFATCVAPAAVASAHWPTAAR